LLIGIGVIFLALIALAVDVARFTGEFHSFDKGFPGSCAVIPLGGSSEDIQIDRERGIAYLSVLNRASLGQGDADNGSIMMLDLNRPEPSARAAMAYDPDDFHPQGLSLFKHAAQAPRLFAISHRPDGSQTVEIAEAGASGEFFPKETIRNPAFVHPNAIAAVGARQFYLANDSGAGGKLGRAIEFLFRRGLSTLIYYDGAGAHVVATGLKFPAGLALSPDASRLYVGEALGQQLRIYRRDLTSGEITLDETVSLDTAPDNLNVDADGIVWIAAHPRLLRFFEHLRNPERHAPTQVLRFDPRRLAPADGEKDSRLSQVYANDGAQISAGTVAAHWHDEFLIGALLDHKVMICKPRP
jgi:arylesterase/paraoxonase